MDTRTHCCCCCDSSSKLPVVQPGIVPLHRSVVLDEVLVFGMMTWTLARSWASLVVCSPLVEVVGEEGVGVVHHQVEEGEVVHLRTEGEGEGAVHHQVEGEGVEHHLVVVVEEAGVGVHH